MHNNADKDWNTPTTGLTWEQVTVAVLMDIREELKRLRGTCAPLGHLNCTNFLAVPAKLDRLVVNTTRLKRKRKRTRA